MSFQDLAFLLLPSEPGRTGTVIETDQGWEIPPPSGGAHDVLLWGRGPLRSGGGRRAAARSALRRERAIRSIGRRTPPERMTVHRLPPPRLLGSAFRHRLRRALLGGALVELAKTGPVRRLIDAAAEAAGTETSVGAFEPGSGGSALVRLRSFGGEGVLLRVARAGGPADPTRGAEALAMLAALTLPEVPRLIDHGATEGVSWAKETVLPGQRPRRVSPSLAAAVARLSATLPRSDEPSTAHDEDLEALAGRFPQWQAELTQLVNDVAGVARAVPSVLRHGDLWAGNLLVRRGRLTGLVDWDAWHGASLPGVDLLHLIGTDEELRSGRGLGQIWLRRPWESERYRSLSADYWKTVRIVPNDRLLQAIGLAWWASYVAASTRRLPELAEDDRWVEQNVEAVLRSLSG